MLTHGILKYIYTTNIFIGECISISLIELIKTVINVNIVECNKFNKQMRGRIGLNNRRTKKLTVLPFKRDLDETIVFKISFDKKDNFTIMSLCALEVDAFNTQNPKDTFPLMIWEGGKRIYRDIALR